MRHLLGVGPGNALDFWAAELKILDGACPVRLPDSLHRASWMGLSTTFVNLATTRLANMVEPTHGIPLENPPDSGLMIDTYILNSNSIHGSANPGFSERD